MPRVLTAEWQTVPSPEQPHARREWVARRTRLAAHGIRHWVFVSDSDPESFLEFTEAGDLDHLRAARVREGLNVTAPILVEVKLP